MENPFKFYQYNEKAYIYDCNQQKIFLMGVEQSGDVAEDQQALIVEAGEEISKEQAWKICGLDKL